ncbi:MAG: hypothetical protein ABGX12_00170 [Desulfurobacteriaceae bacterium]
MRRFYLKLKRIPKKKLLLISLSAKLLEVAVVTYLIKKFWME